MDKFAIQIVNNGVIVSEGHYETFDEVLASVARYHNNFPKQALEIDIILINQ